MKLASTLVVSSLPTLLLVLFCPRTVILLSHKLVTDEIGLYSCCFWSANSTFGLVLSSNSHPSITQAGDWWNWPLLLLFLVCQLYFWSCFVLEQSSFYHTSWWLMKLASTLVVSGLPTLLLVLFCPRTVILLSHKLVTDEIGLYSCCLANSTFGLVLSSNSHPSITQAGDWWNWPLLLLFLVCQLYFWSCFVLEQSSFYHTSWWLMKLASTLVVSSLPTLLLVLFCPRTVILLSHKLVTDEIGLYSCCFWSANSTFGLVLSSNSHPSITQAGDWWNWPLLLLFLVCQLYFWSCFVLEQSSFYHTSWWLMKLASTLVVSGLPTLLLVLFCPRTVILLSHKLVTDEIGLYSCCFWSANSTFGLVLSSNSHPSITQAGDWWNWPLLLLFQVCQLYFWSCFVLEQSSFYHTSWWLMKLASTLVVSGLPTLLLVLFCPRTVILLSHKLVTDEIGLYSCF